MNAATSPRVAFERAGVKLLHAGALEGLRSIPDESVQCCVTSPPYWQLRDYGHPDQLGLESTPAQYVERLVAILEEVRRVLRPDGTLWLNLGDTYASGGRGGGGQMPSARGRDGAKGRRSAPAGMQNKQLVGVPWRVALALSDAGWLLRQDIIWAKPNPLPESVTDRCVRSHEHLFLLTKGTRYVFDHKAIREPAVVGWKSRGDTTPLQVPGQNVQVNIRKNKKADQGRRDADFQARWDSGPGTEERNARDVWTMASAQSDVEHFAVMPDRLASRCILAGAPEGSTVLDPFAGSGTVLLVANRLQRKSVGVELNADYCAIARKRLEDATAQQTLPLAAQVAP